MALCARADPGDRIGACQKVVGDKSPSGV